MCLAIQNTIDEVSGDSISAEFFPLNAHIFREMGGQRLLNGKTAFQFYE